MLIYKLLGDDAQQSFARSWGISYGVGAASEWQARSVDTDAHARAIATRIRHPRHICC
jgi:hypothetical protein